MRVWKTADFLAVAPHCLDGWFSERDRDRRGQLLQRGVLRRAIAVSGLARKFVDVDLLDAAVLARDSAGREDRLCPLFQRLSDTDQGHRS
jgi:hypothetical protein